MITKVLKEVAGRILLGLLLVVLAPIAVLFPRYILNNLKIGLELWDIQ